MKTFDAEEEQAFLKTLWKRKKMLAISFVYFSHNVFYPTNVYNTSYRLQVPSVSTWLNSCILVKGLAILELKVQCLEQKLLAFSDSSHQDQTT